MRDFLFAASQIGPRSAKTEILIRPAVPVAEIQKTVDLLSRELRETDTKIQAANWTTELL
jgi:vacuolar-type H+-ATPase subunit D/Vma8